MGAILSQLKQYAKQRRLTPLLGISLSKLREYHGSFKSICDDFTLDLSDFEDIFGVDKESFAIWDTDGTELIDALELFSGLVIFSDSKFEDKIRFLFDLFDFNELNSLSIVDLQFMLYFCLTSTFKLYNIKQELNEEAISSFLSDSFSEDNRINISQLVKWCAKSPQIHEFFNIIKKEMALVRSLAHTTQHTGMQKFLLEKRGGASAARRPQEAKQVGAIFNNQKYKAKLEYLSSLVSKTQIKKDEANYGAIKDTIIKMNWVYGFRCNDVKHPLKYVGAERGRTVTERLIYFTGCIVVIYDPKSNEQTHYLDHEKEVISLAVSQSSWIATGELGDLPAIHIWDCDTLQNIAILKGIHDSGVHLLSFMKDDEFIVSCGIRTNSPLLIYNIKDTSLVLSTYLGGFALDLRPIVSYVAVPDKKDNSNKYQISESNGEELSGNSFFACTEDSVFVFTHKNGQFKTGELYIQEYEITSPISCCVALKVNVDNPYLKAYANENDKALVFLTGHSGGKVFVWENYVLREELVDYKSEILAITCLDFGVVIATDSSFLYFWDLHLKNNFKKFDLCSLQFKLFSFKITSIAPAKNRMYLATTEGDVVEISLSQKKELHKNTYSYKIEAQKLNNISKLKGTMKAITLLERTDETLVFVAGDSAIISAFSLENHDLVDLWSLGESITAIDIVSFEDGSNVFAMGTISGKIHLRYDWEELPRGYECGARIIDLKFSHDAGYLVAISEVSIVFIFVLMDNSYFNKKPKKIEFEGECPISVNFSDDNKMILLGTSQKHHYLLEINEQNPKPININKIAEKIDLSLLNIRYPSHAKNFINTMQPVSFGKNSNAILAADETGIIFYWKDQENLANNCGGYLKGHSSQIARIVLARNNNIFYSLGTSDRTLIEWTIDTVTEEVEETSQRDLREMNAKMKIEDETLIRELEYSSFFDSVPEKFKDSFTFFRGTTDKTLISILHNHVQPFEDAPYFKRYPNFSIEPRFIYGFQSYEKRNTLHYGHYVHQNKKRGPRDRDSRDDIRVLAEDEDRHALINKEGSLFTQPPTHKQILYAKEFPGANPFEYEHDYCDRYFVYFVSRFAIIYDPHSNTQRFYEGHRYRITSLAMHPSKAIVATGETSPSPCVHIWSLVTLEPLKIIKTFHKNGILNMEFSKDGVFLITVGIDLFYSIQVTKWKSEEIVAFRNTDRACIFSVLFNPFDKYEFVTLGYGNIAVWNIEGHTLLRKEWIHVNDYDHDSLVIFTTGTYFNYRLRKEVGSDIIVGNNFGNIGLITGGKYYSLRDDAHTKMVNCIKVTEYLAKDLVIITSSQDETVKFWDTSFNLLHEFSVRKIEPPKFIEMPPNQDISVQSIDVYGCAASYFANNAPKDHSNSQEKPLILFGTRNGYIIEGAVDRGTIKTKQISEKKIHVSINKTKIVAYTTSMTDMDQTEEVVAEHSSDDEEESPEYKVDKKNERPKISLNFTFYLTNHSGAPLTVAKNYQQKVLYVLHPKLNIMFSIGEDQYLCIWDIEKCTLLKQVRQDIKDITPTALKITPDGDILAIGFNNGVVLLYECKVTANPVGKYSERKGKLSPSFINLFLSVVYNLPALNKITQALKGQVPVLNIEFSSKGDFLAISFDNPKVFKDGEEEKTVKEGSYIDIYVSRNSHKFVKTKHSNENHLYNRYGDIKSQSLYQTHETDANQYGVAAYYMTFSIDDLYLLIYYQTVDNDQIRVNEDTQGHYAVWDLTADNRVWNPDTIKNLSWRKLNFPNSIYAQYLFYSNILGTEDSKKDAAKINRRPIMSAMENNYGIIVAGSTMGDIHFFKERALDIEKDPMTETVEPDKMCMSKTYNAHVSFINQVETKGDFLFSTGMHDGCIVQWNFIQEEEQWETDFRDFNTDIPDPFLELPTKEKFDNQMNEILPLRHQVYEIQQNLDEITDPEIALDLETVIGRKAFNVRNNLFYDFYDRIVYSTGNLLVMLDPKGEDHDDENKNSLVLKFQEFLKIDEGNFFSTAPEISTFTLSNDRRFLCAGTQELNARILIWEICSRTCIKTMKLNNCTAIQIIKFAFDSQHICAVGTSLDYTQVVYLIDSAKSQILGCVNLLNTLPFKIKDISFFPNSIHQFVTCGFQHMSIWKYSGSVLSFSACPLENPKEALTLKTNMLENQEYPQSPDIFVDSKQKEEEPTIGLEEVFLCVCFVQNLIITGGSEGSLYIWKDFKIAKKHTAHFKSILCLSSVQTSNIFVSGGSDGRVFVWQILRNTENNSFIIDMLQDLPLTKEDVTKAYMDPANHIQSVHIDSRRILAGTRNGNIYEIARLKKIDKNKGRMYDDPATRLICHDDETPKCIGFSPDMERIYGITQKGVFCVWNIKDLQLTYTKYLSKFTTAMIVFKFKPLILIAFETELIILNCDNDYLPIPSYRLIYKTQINDVKISPNEKYLAVALASDSNTGARIEMYDLEKEEKTFKHLFAIEELPSSINFLDFSVDNNYLLYKDNLEELTVTDITSKKKINFIHSEFDVEWMSDGIQISEKTKGVQSYYTDDNKIQKMIRIGENTLAVTDEMGTIRLFKYPCEAGSSLGYYRCYTEHMNYINNLVLSSDGNLLLTTSESDKSIFLWRVKYLLQRNEDIIDDDDDDM